MPLEALLLCRDPETLRVFRRALDELGITVEVATVAESALDRLRKAKFDAVIIDCDDVAGGPEVLTGIQLAPSNKRAIAIAVMNGATNMRAAFEMGAHFAFNLIAVHSLEYVARDLTAAKPLDSDSLAEILVSAGEFAGDGFGRKFHADFALHGT